MILEEFLRKKLAKEKVTLIGDHGVEYTFDAHEPRHEDHDFCFSSKVYGIVQLPYSRIKKWQIKE